MKTRSAGRTRAGYHRRRRVCRERIRALSNSAYRLRGDRIIQALHRFQPGGQHDQQPNEPSCARNRGVHARTLTWQRPAPVIGRERLHDAGDRRHADEQEDWDVAERPQSHRQNGERDRAEPSRPVCELAPMQEQEERQRRRRGPEEGASSSDSSGGRHSIRLLTRERSMDSGITCHSRQPSGDARVASVQVTRVTKSRGAAFLSKTRADSHAPPTATMPNATPPWRLVHTANSSGKGHRPRSRQQVAGQCEQGDREHLRAKRPQARARRQSQQEDQKLRFKARARHPPRPHVPGHDERGTEQRQRRQAAQRVHTVEDQLGQPLVIRELASGGHIGDRFRQAISREITRCPGQREDATTCRCVQVPGRQASRSRTTARWPVARR